jgi:hydroxyacylglutathione hydrolase
LNTHCHFDHMGANAEVLAETGAKLAIHPADETLLAMRGGADHFGLPASESPPPDLLLTHGQKLVVAGLEFEVLHTPGHSPGSVSFYAADENVVFSGDVLFAGGIGRADLWQGDAEQLLDSIRDVLLRLPLDTHVYPGHGPMTTIGEERQTNPYLQ